MGHVELNVRIGSPEGKKSLTEKALINTGATFTVIPQNIATKLGVAPTGEKVRVLTAKGPEELDLSHATIEINGKKRIMPVLTSRGIDRVLIGVLTLEAMQLRVNPSTGKLEEEAALLY